jgi:predicted patatin/cPLA2 family phospholipase
MVRQLTRLLGCAGLCIAVAAGCKNDGRSPEELRRTAAWVDPNASAEHGGPTIDREAFLKLADQVRAARRPADGKVPRKRSVLAVSGGGAYGAYSAGVLCGWSEIGTRPEFDVVTGISTGALIAPFAFLGPAYDDQLKQFYTTVTNDDIFKKRRPLKAIFSESFADNAPLRSQIEKTVTPEVMAAVAMEHQKGRRLYIGTTDLEGCRQIIWDLGAIAARGTPQDRKLAIDILLASAAIPGFFPPQRITVTADGQSTTERHVDGGVSVSLFVVPPYVAPEEKATLPKNWLYDSDLYMLLAGKIYSDPTPVPKESLKVAGSSITTVLYAQARGDLQRLFTLSMMAGMNYHLASIPQDFEGGPKSATDFSPAAMTCLFNEGMREVREGVVWRKEPPGLGQGELPIVRTGTQLIGGGFMPPHVGNPMPGFPPMTLEGIPVPQQPFKK